jgi:hypothetical protein
LSALLCLVRDGRTFASVEPPRACFFDPAFSGLALGVVGDTEREMRVLAKRRMLEARLQQRAPVSLVSSAALPDESHHLAAGPLPSRRTKTMPSPKHHELPPLLKQIPPSIRRFDLVADGMRQSHLGNLALKVRALGTPVAER